MTKKHSATASAEYTKLAAVGVIALIVGIIIGPMIMPAQPTTVENKTGVFTPNMQKINEIGKLFEDYYYLQTGNKTVFTYVNASDRGNLILITYSIPDGSSFQIYTTKDYAYLMPSVIPVKDFKSSIEAAIQQLANQENTQTQAPPKSEKPDVKLYIMSFCPYGNVAEQAFNSVIHTLGDTISFEPIYIIYDESISPQYSSSNTDYCMTDDQNNTYCSMHGINELKQGVREIAIYNLYGAETWADYVEEVDNQCSIQDIEDCWKTVAESMNLSTSDIEGYYNDHLYEILADQKEKTFSAGKFGSPSITINGQDYNGGRTSEGFKTAICNALTTQPENCNATLSANEEAASGSCG